MIFNIFYNILFVFCIVSLNNINPKIFVSSNVFSFSSPILIASKNYCNLLNLFDDYLMSALAVNLATVFMNMYYVHSVYTEEANGC